MSLDELIKREFTLDADVLYLNHAAVAPWPVRTTRAVENFARENGQRGAQYYPRWMETESELRKQISTLINAPSPDDIALLKNTSEALSFVAYGLDWQAGDNIVISNQEFPSNQIVWQSLQKFGVEVREVDLYRSATPEQALMDAVDRHTRLLSVSSVQYATGLRMQLEPLGAFCRQHDVLFCVDAIQSIGALQFDVQSIGADFAMADGHKWMLGPEGVALFYCRAELRDQLKLNEYGWHMVEALGDYSKSDWQPATSARRFECGSPNMLGIHALHASLSLLLEAGMAQIEQRLLSRTKYLLEQVNNIKNLRLISDPAPERLSGIVTFENQNCDSEMLYKHLMQSGVICAFRGGGIRFSPHFYSQESMINQAVKKAAIDSL